jgi:hypothetical protein
MREDGRRIKKNLRKQIFESRFSKKSAKAYFKKICESQVNHSKKIERFN